MGAFGEASEDVHTLIETLAESRVQFLGLQRGKQGTEAEIGATKGQIRRMLSVTSVRAVAQCLLKRMSYVGWASSQKEKMGCLGGGEDET